MATAPDESTALVLRERAVNLIEGAIAFPPLEPAVARERFQDAVAKARQQVTPRAAALPRS